MHMQAPTIDLLFRFVEIGATVNHIIGTRLHVCLRSEILTMTDEHRPPVPELASIPCNVGPGG
jgi:hypothetical protein